MRRVELGGQSESKKYGKIPIDAMNGCRGREDGA
jgi:hypothetical protein